MSVLGHVRVDPYPPHPYFFDCNCDHLVTVIYTVCDSTLPVLTSITTMLLLCSKEPTMKTIKVITKKKLKDIIANSPDDADLNHLDVSAVTDMSYLFIGTTFNGDISQWDVSNVTDMEGMFYGSIFNGDISQWDVSNVTNMSDMFWGSTFNSNISKWDVSNVKDMKCMFWGSTFDGNISQWDVGNVVTIEGMFNDCPITDDHNPTLHNSSKDITMKTIKVTTKDQLIDIIANSPDNADLNYLDVSAITDMSYLFYRSSFNGDISQWDVSNVEDMSYMFSVSQFNGDIGKWDISNVKEMYAIFYKSQFNGDISGWDVSNVTDMTGMFHSSQFLSDISKWDMSNVKGTIDMFLNCHIPDNHKPLPSNKEDVSSVDTTKQELLSTIASLTEQLRVSEGELASLKCSLGNVKVIIDSTINKSNPQHSNYWIS